MINLNKVSEGIDYKITVSNPEEATWSVEAIRGEYAGTSFVYEDVSVDGQRGEISFRLTATNAETNELVEFDDEEKVQYLAADIVEDIVKNGISNGTVKINGQNENQ